jgi:hypothetical protein
MNYRKSIRDLWTDDDGNYKLGLENAITPEALLDAMGVDESDEKIYQIARIELNAVCIQICREGYCAGGIGRSPTHYFIAKNPSEERLIMQKSPISNIGRIKAYAMRGKNQLNQRVIAALINQMGNLLEEGDEFPLLEDDT